jgi:hypothetical protein
MEEELQKHSICKFARLKLWAKIHEVLGQANFMQAFCDKYRIDNGAVVLIALSLSENIVQSSDVVIPTAFKISPQHTSVIQYIGGAILRKLGRKYARRSHQAAAEQLETLRKAGHTLDHNYGIPSHQTLIDLKSRGGLLTPSDEFTSFLCSAYCVFKSNVKCHASDFLVMVPASISSHLSVSEDLKIDVLKLFHKILIHHECKLILERYKIKKKLVGKGKALRSKLSDTNSV